MNVTRILLSIICTLAAAGLAIRAVVEHEARVTLDQQNGALRERLSQMDQVIAENQRLSNLVAQASGPPSLPSERSEAPSGTDDRLQELVHLRGEVEVLRQQSKEIETLREDTRQARAVQNNGPVTPSAGQAAGMSSGMTTNGPGLQILSAEYWTENARLDVTAALAAKFSSDPLKAVANNDLNGDPDLGHTKNLTVVYQVGGVTRTNEFREGQPVILPGE
jgi:hypothetical protein